MIGEYVPMERRRDDFLERFREHWIQELNNFEQPSIENSLPFPIEPLRTALATLPQKRVSNTSSDSGGNSPQALSLAMPVTPDKSQPHLVPSTSRMNLPIGPLTPFRQFNINSRKSKNKQPKYSSFQPEHPDLQFVLRTRTRQGYKL